MIARITRAYVRHYRDNNQTTAYVEWVDHNGKPGRTEGPALNTDTRRPLAECYGVHMGALLASAICTGHTIEWEIW